MEKKLIIFDVDNTLVKLKKPFTYVWEIFNSNFNVSDEDYKLYKEWKNGHIKYSEWIRQDLLLYSQKGANKQILESLIKQNTHIEEGTKQLLRKIKNNHNYLGIVSGSVNTMLDIHELTTFFDRIHINRLNYNKRGQIITEAAYHTDYDGNRKIHGLIELAYTYNVPISDCVYIGDGDNDIPIANFLNLNNGTSISFNGNQELEEVSTLQHKGDFINLQNILL